MLSDSHPSIVLAKEVKEIMDPLFQLTEFNFFSYFKQFFDGHRIVLCTNPQWTQYLYTQNYAKISSFNTNETPKKEQNSAYLWDWLPNLLNTSEEKTGFHRKLKDSQQFSINNGISIINTHKDFIECFNFGTSNSSAYVYPFLFHKMDIFERFSVFFKIKAEQLLKSCESYRLILPFNTKEHLQTKETNKNPIDSLLEATTIQKFPCQINGEDHFLLKRHLECLYYTTQGLSAKEIAYQLGISYRTVQKYIEIIKDQFQISSKSELLKISNHPQIKQYFIYCRN